jgi:catechol 2,3-dioxygenase-like lactoylglutathione lyase family enzyme
LHPEAVNLDHLGLPVRDEQRTLAFYGTWFGFDPATARRADDGTILVRNAAGFDLALHPVADTEPLPAFLHVGFRLGDRAEVRTLRDRMEGDGVTIVERDDEADYVAFKCLDPDDFRVEVYWEPEA